MIILGLGSNVGDRLGYLSAAVRQLRTIIDNIRLSRIVESPAMRLPDAPPESDMPFLNMAISGDTALTAHALFSHIKAIEKALGRVQRYVWGPREIDIDILAMDELMVKSAELVIPHCGMLERDFVLMPLVDVAPEWRYPAAGPFHGWKAEDIAREKGYTYTDSLKDTGLSLHVS